MRQLITAVERALDALGALRGAVPVVGNGIDSRVEKGTGTIALGAPSLDGASYIEAVDGRVVLFDTHGVGGSVADSVSWDAESFARVFLPTLLDALKQKD